MTSPMLRPLLSFPLLALPDEGGRLHFPSLEQSVRQAIEIILRTRPGEQLMRPDFGAGLANFVGQPNTVATRRRIRERISEALDRWENRIDVDRVDVFEIEGQPTHVRIEIAYRLKRTGAAAQLGLSMDLGG